MSKFQLLQRVFLFCMLSITLTSCATTDSETAQNTTGLPDYHGGAPYSASFDESKYAALVPQQIDSKKEKVIVVDPKVYAWGAYDEFGKLVRAGIANAGADYCEDEGRPCHTSVGTFHIFSLGNETCLSHQYPVGKGGSLMPYCMFFHNGESLHGTPDPMLVDKNISHGCVHMRIPDVEWLRYNFAEVGTKVVVLPY